MLGLRPDHRGSDVIAAAMRSICFALRSVIGSISLAGREISALHVTGGMSRIRSWMQMLADTCERMVEVRDLEAISGLAGASLVVGAEVRSALEEIPSVRFLPSGDPPLDGYHNYLSRFEEAQTRIRRSALANDACPR